MQYSIPRDQYYRLPLKHAICVTDEEKEKAGVDVVDPRSTVKVTTNDDYLTISE